MSAPFNTPWQRVGLRHTVIADCHGKPFLDCGDPDGDGSAASSYVVSQVMDFIITCVNGERERMSEVLLESLHLEGGKLDATLRGDLVKIFAHCLAGCFEGCGAINYVEYTVTHKVLGELILSIRRRQGKEPSELVSELKAENAILRQQLQEAAQ